MKFVPNYCLQIIFKIFVLWATLISCTLFFLICIPQNQGAAYNWNTFLNGEIISLIIIDTEVLYYGFQHSETIQTYQ
jgi:hypothetical protein